MITVNVFEGKQVKQAGEKQEYPGLPDKKGIDNGFIKEKFIKFIGEKIDDGAESDTVYADTKNENLQYLQHLLLFAMKLSHRFRPLLEIILPALRLQLPPGAGSSPDRLQTKSGN